MAAQVHPNSCECAKSELDLFGVPPTMSSVRDGHWEKLGPVTALTDEALMNFSFLVLEDYVDLGNTNLL